MLARRHAIPLANTAMEPTALALSVRAAAHRESLARQTQVAVRNRQPAVSPPKKMAITVRTSTQQAREIVRALVDHTAGAFKESARQDAQQFIGRWIAFNALYSDYFNGSERAQLMTCVQNSIPNGIAEALLQDLQGEVSFLASLPPGDMRFRNDQKRFRLRSTNDMRVVRDATRAATERLAHLVAVCIKFDAISFMGRRTPSISATTS